MQGLPALMTKNSRNLSRLATLIHKLASKKTKEAASAKLVQIVKYVASSKWKKDKEAELKAANEKAGFKVTGKQFAKQLNDYQNESVTRVYASMKKVGGDAVVRYCLSVASDPEASNKRRRTALAALAGHIDKKDDAAIATLFKIAKDPKTPKVLVDASFRRIKEMPRKKVADELYSFMTNEDWKMRRLAAATILAMSKVKHIPEFLTKLGQRAEKNNFNLAEAQTYGAYLADLKDGDALAKAASFMRSGPASSRLSALAMWMAVGTPKDSAKYKAYLSDKQRVPKCKDDAGCTYQCVVGDDKPQRKEVSTVGDFMTYCVEPAIKKKAANKKKMQSNGKKPAEKGKKREKKGKKPAEKGKKPEKKGKKPEKKGK